MLEFRLTAEAKMFIVDHYFMLFMIGEDECSPTTIKGTFSTKSHFHFILTHTALLQYKNFTNYPVSYCDYSCHECHIYWHFKIFSRYLILFVSMNALIKKNFLYYWLKVVFNKVDESRLKAYGPDRVCSEWLIRNGGKVKFLDSKDYSSDYDELQRYQGVRYIDEVDATEAAITHHGFDHFIGELKNVSNDDVNLCCVHRLQAH